MVLPNAQLGVSSFQKKGIFATSCSGKPFPLSGFSICGRPILVIGFNVTKNKKKSGVFDVRTRGTVISALSKDGSDNQSAGCEIKVLEKEYEFKPSFDQYLKVMGSVKLRSDKDNKSGSKEENPKHSLRSRGVSRRLSSEENEKHVKSGETRRNSDRENVSRVAKLYENANKKKEQNGRKHVRGFKGEYDSRQSNIHEKGKRKIRGGDTRDGNQSKYTGRLEPELDFNSSESSLTRNTKESQRDYSSMGKVFERRNIDVRSKDRFERNNINADKTSIRGFTPRSGKFTESSREFSYRHDDNNMEVERAAFKNFDENDEIMHRPRVSPKEMDERIQKLAIRLNGANIDMPEWEFSEMMRSARIIYTDHSILRVIQLLGKHGNWKMVLQVIEWLQMRERFNSNKLRYIYTTALDVLGKAKRPVEALNVFHAMLQQLSSYPDIVAYHAIAVTLGQAGHIKELFDVIDTMRSPPKKKFKTGALENWNPRLEPDLVVYNSVLNACVQRKQWEGAIWVLEQLAKKGIQPAPTTYGLVMEVMYACGKYNLVHDFFKKLQESSVPNALNYRVLVKTLWREDKINEAIRTVHNMEGQGIVGSAALYYDFARCLCSAGRCQEALKQIEKICKVANKPLVVTFTGLIQACLDSGSIENGSYVFNQMKSFCSPNLVTCNMMLKGYLDHGMFEEAIKVFEEMSEGGFNISSKSGYQLRVTPDIYTFNTLLNACITEKRWDDFEFFYKMMLQNGFNFNARRHLRMIFDACRAGKGELLDITWTHLTEADQIPPPDLIKKRFCTKLEEDDYAAAISCIAKTNHNDLHFSKTAWLNLFKANAEKFQKATIARLYCEAATIAAKSDKPNRVLENFMISCRELDTTLRTGDITPSKSVFILN